MTIGAIARTRASAAAVSHVVQPRLDAPETMKLSTGRFHSLAPNACSASIALTTLFTIGKSRGQFSSPVFR